MRESMESKTVKKRLVDMTPKEFEQHKAEQLERRRAYDKKRAAAKSRAWYTKHPEKERERNRKKYSRTKEKMRDNNLRFCFGITLIEY
jgi:Na+-transporting NADH:ubiquinone oxidoreductase subunit NqrC